MKQGTMDLTDLSASRSAGGQTAPLSSRFMVAWKSADSVDSLPRIQDYVNDLTEPERSTAFCTLLAAELKCRQEDGEHPSPEEYYRLFPEAAELIRAVFAESGIDFETVAKLESPRTPKTGTMEQQRLHTQTVDYCPTDGQDGDRALEHQGETGDWLCGLAEAETRERPEKRSLAPVDSLPTVPGYEILGRLGQGGMGVVYKARHLKLDRLVALKMIRSRGKNAPDTRSLQLFLAEARAVAQFQHPNLVQIYEIGEFDGQPYITLELLEGGNLNQRLAGTPQPASAASSLVETLARAAEYAHQKGIVHRDLKPANILLSADGIPKIADFGLAKKLDRAADQSEQGGIVGTPSYMAPEQALGNNVEVGPSADIYALGAILYEMLTGRPPFKAASHRQTIELVCTQDVVPPRQLVPQVPRDLELICLRCLTKDPSQRFPSARELAEELRRLQEGRPILTRATPLWEQAWKWAKRKPAAASLIVMSGLAVVALVMLLNQRAVVADERAVLAQRKLREQQRIGDLRDRVQQLHLKAQEAADRDQLPEAQKSLSAAFEIIETEPSLTEFKEPLTSLGQQVALRVTEQTEKQAAKAAFDRLLQLRHTALFHGLVFTGVDLPVNVKATKAACAEAVALIQDKLGPTAPPVLSKHLTDEQKRRCSAICYELLLVWADAEAQPEPGAKKPTQSQLETALKLMDRAVAPDSKPTRSYHLRRAAYLELLPNADEALREQQLASATPPQGALDYFLMGTTHQRTSGQLAEAAADFAKALQAEPDHFWARYFLGVCNLRQQPPQLEQARDNFTACLVAQPDFPWLYLFRGFAHGLLNEYQAAEDDHRRALALSPDPQAVYSILVNQGVLCMRQARQAAGTAPFRLSDPFTPNLNLAVAAVADAFRRDRLLAAAGYLNKAAAQNPRQYLAYHYLALLAQEQKQLPEALQLLDKAIKEAEDREPSIRAQLFGQRARVHQERKDLDAALEDLKCSLEILPGAADQMERGRILLARQRYLDAIAAFEDVHRLRPSEADAYRWKAEALRAMHLDKEAAQALDQYLAKGGRPTADFYRTRGQVRVQLRQLPPALADYTQSLTLQPDARTYTARGWVFLANEVLPLALQDFEEALRSDPENGEAYAGRGLVRVRMGQYEQGLADAEAAVNQGRHESSRLFWNTAHVYAQMMSRLAVEPGAQNARIGLTKARCFDRALEMLRRALDQVPAGERARFWRQYVAKDALLNPIRGTPGFDRLEREYGQ